MEATTAKTIDILSRIVKKTPLNHKLLSRPPFRYLHDLITEIIQTSGYATGLYSETEFNSENMKEKESKMAFLKKIIDVVSLSTKISLKAHPAKIVAGLEAMDTNAFLQILGKAVIKKVPYQKAVAKVTGNASSTTTTTSNNVAGSTANIAGSTSSLSQKQKSSPSKEKSSNNKAPQQTITTPKQATQEKNIIQNTQEETTPEEEEEYMVTNQESLSSLPQTRNQELNEETNKPTNQPQQMSKSEPVFTSLKESNVNLTTENQLKQVIQNASITSSADVISVAAEMHQAQLEEESRPKLARPVTARAAPPKSKRAVTAAAEPAPIIKKIEVEDANEKETDFFIIDEDKPRSQLISNEEQDKNHAMGSLVRDMMNVKLQDSLANAPASLDNLEKNGKNTKMPHNIEDLDQFNKFIHQLSGSISPLTSTLDYIQEDLNAIKTEHDAWQHRRTQVEQLLQQKQNLNTTQLFQFEKQMNELNLQIQFVQEEIKVSKNEIYQNDKRIQSLLQHIMTPVR